MRADNCFPFDKFIFFTPDIRCLYEIHLGINSPQFESIFQDHQAGNTSGLDFWWELFFGKLGLIWLIQEGCRIFQLRFWLQQPQQEVFPQLKQGKSIWQREENCAGYKDCGISDHLPEAIVL